MLTLRELAIRIVKAICKFSQWRSPEYVKHLLHRDQQRTAESDDLHVELPQEFQTDAKASTLSNSFFYFESKAGQGNVLDFIRSGRAPEHKPKNAGREILVFKEVRTHILDRMKLFFEDGTILYIPKEESQIERDIAELNGSKNRYHTQEVGIFYKVVEQLKFKSPEEQ